MGQKQYVLFSYLWWCLAVNFVSALSLIQYFRQDSDSLEVDLIVKLYLSDMHEGFDKRETKIQKRCIKKKRRCFSA